MGSSSWAHGRMVGVVGGGLNFLVRYMVAWLGLHDGLALS